MLGLFLFGSLSCIPAVLLRFVIRRRAFSRTASVFLSFVITIIYYLIMFYYTKRSTGFGADLTPFASYFILRHSQKEVCTNSPTINQSHQQSDRIV